jgi:peptidoglycan hydrolase-like protein with peptidoglycan-binding domain
MTRAAASIVAVMAFASIPAAATAQTPPVTPPPATPPPATPPPAAPPPAAPAPATAKLSLKVERARVLAGDRWRVRGTLKPYVAGQEVIVRFSRGSKKLRARKVTPQPAGGGTKGVFVLGFSTSRAGRVTVRASHAGTPQLATTRAKAKRVRVLALRARPGGRGPAVRLLQARLASLGYVVGKRGLYDARTARAVLAFRKVSGLARTPFANREVFRRLANGGGRFKIRFPSHGRHVEGSISKQVIALIDKGKVVRIYPISSGAAATPTVRGNFRVYRKDYGTNSHGMVHSSYFIGGYAIHGYASVPTYNASHGCLRVPIPDALAIFNWVNYGTRVDVYD